MNTNLIHMQQVSWTEDSTYNTSVGEYKEEVLDYMINSRNSSYNVYGNSLSILEGWIRAITGILVFPELKWKPY